MIKETNSEYNLHLGKPVFLHFLNRELYETENVKFSDDYMWDLILTATLITDEYIYSTEALLAEGTMQYSQSMRLLLELEKYKLARVLSNDSDRSIYLNKRRQMYQHDKRRYPIYFKKTENFPWPKTPVNIWGRTTDILVQNFREVIFCQTQNQQFPFSKKDKDNIYKKLEKQHKENLAVTIALFKQPFMKKDSEYRYRRFILYNYNRRFLHAFQGLIVTGIPGILYYDKFQNTNLMLDYNTNQKILKALGIYPQLHNLSKTVAQVAELKSSPLYRSLIQLMRTFCIAITVAGKQYGGSYFLDRSYESLKGINGEESKVEDCIIRLEKVIQYLQHKIRPFYEIFERIGHSKIRIGVLAATPIELSSLYKVASLRDCLVSDDDRWQKPIKKCKYIQNMEYEIYLLKIGKGPIAASEKLTTWEANITFDYIIAGGICAGIYPDKQELGDIIVSEQVQDLCDQKIENKRTIRRGKRQDASQYLLDKMAAEQNLQQNRVTFGLVLSASIMSNDPEYMQKLRTEYPDARGYEMEATSVINAKGAWIVAKAISDWGEGKSDHYQSKAAECSYQFIFDVLEHQIIKIGGKQ